MSITYDQLHSENHMITELSNVFLYLIRERGMCDTQIACNLFFDYVQHVKNHLEVVDKNMYKELLASPEHSVNIVAQRFMSGSSEIRKIFNDYARKWTTKKGKHLKISNFNEFQKETEEVFNIVLDRIQRETEHLYPLVRQFRDDAQVAA